MEALAARLVSAFADHEVGLEEYLDGLRPDELHGLTALLESNARRKLAVVPLLQVLLHLPVTRLPAGSRPTITVRPASQRTAALKAGAGPGARGATLCTLVT